MIDESMDREQMKQPPQPWEFRSKPSGQRLLIMTGGVLFNFILHCFCMFACLYLGETYLPTANVKYGIVTDSVGYSIGLRNGDKILPSIIRKLKILPSYNRNCSEWQENIQVTERRNPEYCNSSRVYSQDAEGNRKDWCQNAFQSVYYLRLHKKISGKVAGCLSVTNCWSWRK